MDESNIINKQVIEKAVDEAVASVQKFTVRQLKTILTNKTERPKIIPVLDLGLIVGDYAIKNYKNHWYVTSIYDTEKETQFMSRVTAVLYALSEHNRNHTLSADIARYDADVDRITQKVNYYRHRARAGRSEAERAIANNRLAEFEHQLRHSRILLAKRLKMAKYFYL